MGIILTKSMFKGIGWLNGSGKTWEDYWEAFRKYHHALYITQVGNDEGEATIRMNFQFLNTLNLTTEEFSPADLPLGWDHSPSNDPREWVTKETEQEYYNFFCDEAFRLQYFLKRGRRCIFEEKTRDYYLAHRRENTDWVVFPVSGFDNYYCSSYFSKKVLGKIPETILVRQERSGISRYYITEAFLP